MTSNESATSKTRIFALASIVLGAIGLFASFELATEYIKTLKSPDYIPNCAVSILVTCGPNMDSWQGSLFGFTNTIIGLIAFVAPIIIGFALLAGARFSSWFWWAYRAGLALGTAFIFWLAYQSIFVLGTLCPWCMVVWTVMIPLFFSTAFRPEAHGYVSASAGRRNLFETFNSWAWVFIFVSYVAIAAVAQFQLDWIAEFTR